MTDQELQTLASETARKWFDESWSDHEYLKADILAALRRAAGGQYEAKDRETITFAATLCANLSRQQTLDDRDRRACADLRRWLETLEAKIYPPMPAPPSDEEK